MFQFWFKSVKVRGTLHGDTRIFMEILLHLQGKEVQ